MGSPSWKILDDLYHQQISEGNLIPNIDKAWDEIGYFQIGDNPGRNEPTTGEINYKNVFRHIHPKGYTGILGMEHANSIRGVEGEQALIEAYLEVDGFEVQTLAGPVSRDVCPRAVPTPGSLSVSRAVFRVGSMLLLTLLSQSDPLRDCATDDGCDHPGNP